MKKMISKMLETSGLAINRLTLFNVLPLFWGIEMVYLSANFVCQSVLPVFVDWYSDDLLPDIVWVYNAMIFDFFERFVDTVFLLSIVLFFTGIFLLPLIMSKFGGRAVVRYTLTLPLHSSVWLFFISITYALYCYHPVDFVLLPIILIGLEAGALSKTWNFSYGGALALMFNRISFALNKGDPAYPCQVSQPQTHQE